MESALKPQHNVPLATIGMEPPAVLNNKIARLEHTGTERPVSFSSKIVLLGQSGMEQPAAPKLPNAHLEPTGTVRPVFLIIVPRVHTGTELPVALSSKTALLVPTGMERPV